jgi:hypothetical protein
MATPMQPTPIFVNLNCDVWLIVLDFLDSRDCRTQYDLVLRREKPLKALALVNRKFASMVRPHLFMDLSVFCPYEFAVLFLAGSKLRATDWNNRAQCLYINSTNDFSGFNEVFFNFLGKLTRLHTLRITMMPCYELISRLRHQSTLLQIASVTHLTIDCEGLELLKFCPSVTKLDIICNKRDGFCYLTASVKQFPDAIPSTRVDALSRDCYSGIFPRIVRVCGEVGQTIA